MQSRVRLLYRIEVATGIPAKTVDIVPVMRGVRTRLLELGHIDIN